MPFLNHIENEKVDIHELQVDDYNVKLEASHYVISITLRSKATCEVFAQFNWPKWGFALHLNINGPTNLGIFISEVGSFAVIHHFDNLSPEDQPNRDHKLRHIPSNMPFFDEIGNIRYKRSVMSGSDDECVQNHL